MDNELLKIIDDTHNYTWLATVRENKIAFVDRMRTVLNAYEDGEISLSKVCEIVNCWHLQKVQPKINLGKKPISVIKKVILAVLWFFHDPNDRKSWEEAKHGAIKHTCIFRDPVVIHGIHFRKCIHYGCNTYDPVD